MEKADQAIDKHIMHCIHVHWASHDKVLSPLQRSDRPTQYSRPNYNLDQRHMRVCYEYIPVAFQMWLLAPFSIFASKG